MTELRTEMVPIEVDKACTCLAGRMRPTGTALMSNPAQYVHECNRCGKQERFRVRYPYIVYEPAAGRD